MKITRHPHRRDHGKLVTIHHEYEVKNKEGQVIAKIKKEILKLFGSEWWMEDTEGHEIARIKGNIANHAYEMIAQDKTIIAKVSFKLDKH